MRTSIGVDLHISDTVSLRSGTFVIDGPVQVMITISEVGNGTLKTHAKVLGETGTIGDLRGGFFDVADESLISGLRITGTGVAGSKVAEDGVAELGSGNNVNGSIINEYGKFDVGVAFGTAGIGKEIIREASFILSHAALTIYNAEGTAIDNLQFTDSDFIETPLGFELNVQDVSGLDRFAGQSNTASLVIDFDRNGDAVADSSVSMDVAIEGVLPESFDFA